MDINPIPPQPPVVNEPTGPLTPDKTPIVPSTNKSKSTPLIYTIIILLVVVVGTSFYAIYSFLNSEVTVNSEKDSNSITIVPTPSITPTDIEPSSELDGLSQVKFQAPKLEKIDIFGNAEADGTIDIEGTQSYQIGTSGDWKIYAVDVSFSGPAFYRYSDYFLTNGLQKVYVLESSMDDWTIDAIKKSATQGTEFVNNVDGLPKYPSKFAYKTQEFELPTPLINIGGIGSETKLPQKIGDESGFELMVAYQNINGVIDELKPDTPNNDINIPIKGYYSRQVFLSQPITKFGKYYNPFYKFVSDDKKIIAKWSDGRSKNDIYSANSDICGGYAFGLNVVKSSEINEDDLKIVGKTNDNESLYQLKTKDSDLLKTMYYGEYAIGRSVDDETYKLISIDEFVNKPSHFLYKDALGDYVVFMNEMYAGLAECGKPVVYLYPEKTMEVTVKVDAEITKSDPAYNDGWTAIAEPNGSLTVDGKKYESLYWDGYGNGAYPDINSYGYVVETSKVEPVIRTHLDRLGLNANEIEDFVEYWIPLMPSTKYVRFTWIGTQDMNKMAALDVNPKPDTMIRVFMDYKGVNQYESLKPQNLTKLERKGFTLVEWGGLLRR